MIYNGDNSYINGKYIPMAKNLMTKSFKNVDESLIEDGIRYSIQKRLNVKEAEIYIGFLWCNVSKTRLYT